jgi:hypothetical protein
MASLSTGIAIRLDEEALEAIRRLTAAVEALVRQQERIAKERAAGVAA